MLLYLELYVAGTLTILKGRNLEFGLRNNGVATCIIHCLASQIQVGGIVLEWPKGERKVGLSSIYVLKGVPECVVGAEERAANLVPVALGVLHRGDSRAGVGSNYFMINSWTPNGERFPLTNFVAI